ncbi:MAG: FAD-dependent oxidoreductase [Pirellulales bacterium]|nr:FAD-dependent oxidoreductase [Pirellulales bacterium]
MLPKCLTALTFFVSFLFLPAVASAAKFVQESAREIPVAYTTDVVVVGGSTGAVAAAIAAAEEGANVFLAAPYPYLGEDMTATLRLWLEEGEQPVSPLAKKIFDDPRVPVIDANRLDFTYQTDVPSGTIHKDSEPPSLLTNGIWLDPITDSVQYERNTNIIADLGVSKDIRQVQLMVFRRTETTSAGGGFDVRRVTVSVSDDKKTWNQVAVITNDQPSDNLAILTADLNALARYVQLFVEMPDGYHRMLLGEIRMIGPEKGPVEKPRTAVPPPRPLHVKRILDDALLAAKVQYLYSCYVTDLLLDSQEKPCGLVMANRAGRQAVLAKTIIDATPRAAVARLARAKFRPFQGGMVPFQRVVIGGQPRTSDGIESRIIDPPFYGSLPNRGGEANNTFKIIEYSLPLQMEDGSWAVYMKADQQARSLTYDPEQQYASDVLFAIPPDAMFGCQTATGPWQGTEKLPMGAFKPSNVDRFYVLSGSADVSRVQAEQLVRPLSAMDLGQRFGKAAARDALGMPPITTAKLAGRAADGPVLQGEIREFLTGIRPTQKLPTISQDSRPVPVLAEYDVVVVGGGTSGAPAGIGAARRGAKTLVIEYLYGLGGVGTQGAITKYYWGNRVGFTASVQGGQTEWQVEQRMEWYRQELLNAGADIWFGTIGCGTLVHDHRVAGVVVATPDGRGVVLAKTVIDATGNSDVAASAGAECLYTDANEFGMQGTGLPGRQLGGSYNNTDFTIVDETDMLDVWRIFVFSKDKYRNAFDHGRLIDTRERRRIAGDLTMTLPDQVNERTYPDSVVRAYSNFDTHGFTIDPYLLLEHPEKKGIGVYIPFRAMLPKGFDGILVSGLGISAHRDAVPLIRMQPDIQNGGYAAGVAAAMAAETDVRVRDIDIKALQQHLVEIGNLPDTVLQDQDSYPLPNEKIAEAVESLKQGRGASVIITHPGRAMPLLEAAYRVAKNQDKRTYAKALAVLGNDIGLDTLIAEVQRISEWDEGWDYRGMGQFGAAMSPLDSMILGMGRTRNPTAIPAILGKLKMLNAESEFSHHRAVGLALEWIGHESAARPLAELLNKSNMTGYVHTTIEVAKKQSAPGGTNTEQARSDSLRELILARALYRCGDFNGLGEKILTNYTQDLRGHLARHAKAILEQGKTDSK